MANSRSRKSAPTRPSTSREPRSTPDGGRAVSESPSESAATTKRPAKPAAATGREGGRRFGDGGNGDAIRKGSGATKGSGGAKSTGGRGPGSRKGRGKVAPPVRVRAPKPWGTIVATIAVVVFAAGAIGYAVYQTNSSSLPDSPEDIPGISVTDYTRGQEHVTTDVDYAESPPIGGPHDLYWADCDGAVYDQQVRSENALHDLEHGAIWITYNPDDLGDADLSVLTQYVQGQPYILLSPYAGLTSPVSLQSWNHQLLVDAVDDPRIGQFIQLLRQNPAEYPEVGATCSQPAFLADPVLEGEQSRVPEGAGTQLTDPPTAP